MSFIKMKFSTLHSTNKRAAIIIGISLVIVTVIAFEGVRRNGFVYDDRLYVTENNHVKSGITFESIKWAFMNIEGANWHPLTWLSHLLDYELFGLEPAGHHVVNLLIHIVNVLLLFEILRRSTGGLWQSAFVAAVFAIHPLRVESVAWIAERKDVLSGLFWMLTVMFYLWYIKKPGAGRYVVVALLFALGLMAKAMLVTLPFVLLLMDYWPLGRMKWSDTFKNISDTNTGAKVSNETMVLRLVIEKIPLFVLSAAASVITFMAQKSYGAMRATANVPFGFLFENALVSYMRYLAKTFFPSKLASLYPFPYRGWPVIWVGAALVIILIVTLLVVRFRRAKYLTVGWLWYLGTLVPVLGLVQVGVQSIADRYTYLPLIGIYIMVAWGAGDISGVWRAGRIAIGILGVCILAVLLVCTHKQVGYWRNDLTLYGHAVEVTERNYVMHTNYGVALENAGHFDEAIRHLTEALTISPVNYRPHEPLAEAYLQVGNIEQAIYNWSQMIKHDPNLVRPLNNLAWIRATSRDDSYRLPEKAVELAYRACKLTGFEDARFLDTLAVAYAAAGNFPEAVKTAEKAIKLAEDANEKNLAEEIQKRLELYKAGRPYYER